MAVEVFGLVVRLLRPVGRPTKPASAYHRTSRTYIVARAICNTAKGMAGLTKRPDDIAESF